ncbi:MAG: DUF1501 domain-containing protein [Bacteroidota bacterium]
MKRRNFLRTVGALSLPTLGGFSGVRATPSLIDALINPDSDRVLVIIQLFGGNDGLNTLVPLDQYRTLELLRPGIILPEDGVLPIEGALGFHPRMTGMSSLFRDGQIGIIQNVGYPNQNRSHFRSTDIWNSASRPTQQLTTGWLGRYLDEDYPDFPTGYPNATAPHPPAISVNNVAHPTCQGKDANLALAVLDPTDVTPLAPGGNVPLEDDNYGREMEFLRSVIAQSNAFGNLIQNAADLGTTTVDYPERNPLADQLRKVALMISGGLKTKVYTVYLGGFDTHANQVVGDPSSGNHANQLGLLSEAIEAFVEDLQNQRLSERVMGFTFSEFGRRIRNNDSRGTDHGTAGPMFFFGGCTAPTVLGDNPELDESLDQTAGVPMQYDFRDVYASVLTDWFGASPDRVRTVLGRDFQHVPIMAECSIALPVTLLNFVATGRDKRIDLSWETSEERDNRGFEIERSEDYGDSFTYLGWVPAALRPLGGVRTYEYTDQTARLGIRYLYRLKQMDEDGSYQYSPLRSARLTGTAPNQWQIGRLFPNPATVETQLEYYAPTDGTMQYELFTADGKRVMGNTIGTAGLRQAHFTLSIGQLPVGIYTLAVTTPDGSVHRRKLMVQ